MQVLQQLRSAIATAELELARDHRAAARAILGGLATVRRPLSTIRRAAGAPAEG